MNLPQKRKQISDLVDAGVISMNYSQVAKLSEHLCDKLIAQYGKPPTKEAQTSDLLETDPLDKAVADLKKLSKGGELQKKQDAAKKQEAQKQALGGGGQGDEDLFQLIARGTAPYLKLNDACRLSDKTLIEALEKRLKIPEKDDDDILAQVKKALDERDKLIESAHKTLLDSFTSAKEQVLSMLPSTEITINNAATGEAKKLDGLFHKQLPEILQRIQCRTPNGFPLAIWLWGAAGGGKTTLTHHIGEALGQRSRVISMGPTYTEAKLLGYRNIATGEYIPGELRDYYEHGGVVMLDEADSADPSVLVSSNAALSNESFLFPDGVQVDRHKDFFCLAGANTMGTGATNGYRRNALDAATLDRFVPYKLEYDTALEFALGAPHENFVRWVHKCRKFLEEQECHVVMGMRAIIHGASMLSGGIPKQAVVDATLAHVPEDVREELLRNEK